MALSRRSTTVTSLASFVFLLSLFRFSLITSVFISSGVLLGVLCFLELNRIVKRDMQAQDIYNDTRRNFRFLLLGSTRVWMCADVNSYNAHIKNRIISFAFYQRSIFASSLILQRMYSFLMDGGAVILTVDFNSHALGSTELSFADKKLLHPVTLESLGIRKNRICNEFPLLLHFKSSIGYLIHKCMKRPLIGKRDGAYEKWQNAICGKDGHVVEHIESIVRFCKERNLKILIGYIVTNREMESVSKKINAKLKSHDLSFQCCFLRSMKELDEIVVNDISSFN